VFFKPVINLLTLPLNIVTLGIFSRHRNQAPPCLRA
jgi:uncharacterized membrane protein YvlD (DUF360 family)